MITAEKLFNTLTGFVAMNQNFDKINGDSDETILKARAANYALIRQAVIAGDFITGKGLDKQFRKYEEKVNMEVAKIVSKQKN